MTDGYVLNTACHLVDAPASGHGHSVQLQPVTSWVAGWTLTANSRAGAESANSGVIGPRQGDALIDYPLLPNVSFQPPIIVSV